MASVNQTRPHYVNQMGKTHSKPLAARNGRGTAWARHAVCESALRESSICMFYEHGFKNLNGEYCSAIDYKENRGSALYPFMYNF